jgi:hypothetical protein
VSVAVPGLTSVLAAVFTVLLLDQWRDRRRGFQLAWAVGTLCYTLGSGAEALAAANGWSEPLYRTWYLAGGLLTAGWLGLGTGFLLARTRFGYTYAALMLFAGFIALVSAISPKNAGAGPLPFVFAVGTLLTSVGVFALSYFASDRWSRLVAAFVVVLSLAAIAITVAMPPLPGHGYLLNTAGQPVGDAMPPYLRLIAPVMNISGGGALVLGAVFSAYVFMPKRRVLPYSLDPTQPGDQFLFNLLIAVPAIAVNLAASLPGALRDLLAGRLHSRVPATLLIALGALVPLVTDSLAVAGSTGILALGKLVGIVLLFAGFLVSTEVFREVRIPMTSVRLATSSRERARRRDEVASAAAGQATSGAATATTSPSGAGRDPG